MHLKRQSTKRFWPIPRKGTTFVAVASHEKNKGIPLITIVRDTLKLVKSKKEIRRLVNEKKILINAKEVRDLRYPILLFDVLSFPSIKKHYRAILKGKRVGFEEIKEEEAEKKTYKVVSKKQLSKGKVQLNLNDGKNILSSDKIEIGSFVVLNLKKNKIIEKLALEKGVKVLVVKGKHIGVYGKIKDLGTEEQDDIATITSDGEEIHVEIKNLFIVTGGK